MTNNEIKYRNLLERVCSVLEHDIPLKAGSMLHDDICNAIVDRKLPKGWEVIFRNDMFNTILTKAPNGYTAITTDTSRNPDNVLHMLVQDLMCS